MSIDKPNIKNPTDKQRYYDYMYHGYNKPFGITKEKWANFIKIMQTQEEEAV